MSKVNLGMRNCTDQFASKTSAGDGYSSRKHYFFQLHLQGLGCCWVPWKWVRMPGVEGGSP